MFHHYKKLPVKIFNRINQRTLLSNYFSQRNSKNSIPYEQKKLNAIIFKRFFKASVVFKNDFNELLKTVNKINTEKRKSESFLRILGNGNHGSPKSILLVINQEKYLFNCGEGVSRILFELGYFKFFKDLNNILLTNSSWRKSFSGAIDLIHAIAVSGITKEITFHAPFEPVKFLNELFCLFQIKNMKFNQQDYSKTNEFVNKNLKIKVINLKNVNAYICTINYEDYDKFHSKCDDLNILQEKRFYLKNGEDVLSNDKKIITFKSFVNLIEDASINKLHFHKFLVLDLPTLEHTEMFSKYINSNDLTNLDLIIHFSPNQILKSTRYKMLFDSYYFKHTHNIYLDEKENNLVSKNIYLTQILHNELNSTLFPLLPFQFNENNSYSNQQLKSINGKTSMAYKFTSSCAEDFKRNFITWYQFNQFFIKNNYDLDSIQKFKLKNEALCGNENYPKLLFLGTSSSISTLIRNQSGILVKLDACESILLDCGENILGQFIRFHGEDNYMKELVKIKAVFISHIHTDHQQGVYNLIIQRAMAFKNLNLEYKKLIFLHPSTMIPFIDTYKKYFSQKLTNFVQLIDNEQLLDSNVTHDYIYENILNLKKIVTANVNHIDKSYGLIIETKNKKKIVYSGDCSPSEELIQKGWNCDILIHEATFNNENYELAKKLKHSTKSQAIEVANKMKADLLILTHFNYKTLNKFADEIYKKEPGFNNLVIAHDNMLVNYETAKICSLLLDGCKYLNPENFLNIYQNFLKI